MSLRAWLNSEKKPPMMRKGDRVKVRRAGSADEWCPATVEIISKNGVSIALSLDGLVREGSGAIVGGALLLIAENGTCQSLTGGFYDLEAA